MDYGRDYSKPKDLTCMRVLGKGAFGTVYLADHCQLGNVAVKVGRSSSLEEEKMFEREARRMIAAGSHPSVVSFFGIVDPTTDYSAIIMELVEHGSLKSFRENYIIPSACKVQMIRDIASGMCFLHTLRNPIIHRDLKLENIFVDGGLLVKVGDFGLATSCRSALGVQSGGTLSHIPPESLPGFGNKPPTPKFDVFSYGVTIWELYSGKTPYEDVHSALITHQVTRTGNPGLDLIPDDTPPFVCQLIEDACDIDADKRHTFQEILQQLEIEYKTNYSRDYNEQISELHAQVAKFINSSTHKDATDGPRARFPWERKKDYPDSSNDSPKPLMSVVTPVGTEPVVKIPVPVSDPTPDEYKPDLSKALTGLKITTNQQEGEKFGMAETRTPDDRDAGGRNISATGVEDQCWHGVQPESGGDQVAVAESSIQSMSSDHTSVRGHQSATHVQQTGLVPSRPLDREVSQQVYSTKDSKKRVTEQDIRNIAVCIGKKWMHLGRKLGLEEHDLEIIGIDNSDYGVKEMTHQMLIQWLRCQVGPSRSRGALAKILWELGLEAAVKELL